MRIQYALSGVLLAIMTALILEGAFGWSLILGWLIGINAFALIFYAIDKLNSQATALQAVRVPEFSLLSLALLGGSPAALLTMLLLRHKVSKNSFLLWFVLVVAAQGAALFFFWDRIPWPAGILRVLSTYRQAAGRTSTATCRNSGRAWSCLYTVLSPAAPRCACNAGQPIRLRLRP